MFVHRLCKPLIMCHLVDAFIYCFFKHFKGTRTKQEESGRKVPLNGWVLVRQIQDPFFSVLIRTLVRKRKVHWASQKMDLKHWQRLTDKTCIFTLCYLNSSVKTFTNTKKHWNTEENIGWLKFYLLFNQSSCRCERKKEILGVICKLCD